MYARCTEQDTQLILTFRKNQHMRALTCSAAFINACTNSTIGYLDMPSGAQFCQSLTKTSAKEDAVTCQTFPKTH